MGLEPGEGHPDVSVVIPAYNDAETLERAIRSCLVDGGCFLEVIVVDDASTDDTPEVISRLAEQDPRVRTVRHDENRGTLEARRTGVLNAKGSSVTFLDGDDWFDPDVCSRALALQRERAIDIVHFPIIPSSDDKRLTPQQRQDRLRMFAACDLSVEGPDILHLAFRDGKITWNLAGKLFSKTLLEEAYARIPSQRLFMGDDAYVFFVVCTLARSLVSSSELPCYHYDTSSGDTHSDGGDLSSDEFATLCGSGRVVEGLTSYLSDWDLHGRYDEDLEALSSRLVSVPASRFPQDVVPSDRSDAFDAFLNGWPTYEAIGSLAAYHWGEGTRIADATRGAQTFARSSRLTRTVALYLHLDETHDVADSSVRTLDMWRSMGIDVVLLLDDGQPVPAPLPEGVRVESIPSASASEAGDFLPRARALQDIILHERVDMLVYRWWLSPTLLWDEMVTKSLGASFVLDICCSFVEMMGQETPEALDVPAACRLANGVVCPTSIDTELWKSFNDKVYLAGPVSVRERDLWGEVFRTSREERRSRRAAKTSNELMWDALISGMRSNAIELHREAGRIRELQERAECAEDALEQTRGALDSIEKSLSFRLGRVMTGPLRSVRDHLGDKS